jgi:murein endopeptidase
MKFVIKQNTGVFISNGNLIKDNFQKRTTTSQLIFYMNDIVVDPIGTFSKDKTIAANYLKNKNYYVFQTNFRNRYWGRYNFVIVPAKDVFVLNCSTK